MGGLLGDKNLAQVKQILFRFDLIHLMSELNPTRSNLLDPKVSAYPCHFANRKHQNKEYNFVKGVQLSKSGTIHF